MEASNRITLIAAVGVLFAASLTSTTAWAQTSYTITDLGTLGGSNSTGGGINASGQVAGCSYITGDAAWHAFRYSGSTMTDLGTLGGTDSFAKGINESGQVVGTSSTTGNAASHAFLYSGSTMTDLGTLGGTGSSAGERYWRWGYTSSGGINASSQVVGNSNTTGDATYHAFRYSGSTMTDLGTLGGTYSGAEGINASGQVAGFSYTTGDATYHAFRYSGSTMTDLGTLGGNYSLAEGINDSGQIVGTAITAGDAAWHAFRYSGSTMTDLGTLGGTWCEATGINASGQVVGSSYITGNGACHAFRYSGSTMTDLNSLIPASSGWTLSFASAINNVGQIAGTGINAAGQTHAFLLTPIPMPTPTQTPSLAAFPAVQNPFATVPQFVQLHGQEFSPDAQQFLMANSTPAMISSANNWKQYALATATGLEDASKVLDFVLAAQADSTGAGIIKWGILQCLPAQVQNAAALADLIPTFAEDGPVVGMLAVNSYIYGTLVAGQLKQFAHDPTDSNYQQPVVILSMPTIGSPISTGNSALDSVLTNTFSDTSKAAVYLEATNTAYNRYCTATAASDGISAGMQLEGLLYYMNLYEQAAASSSADMASLRIALTANGMSDAAYDPSFLARLQATVSTQGLDAETINMLTRLGLNQDDINGVIQEFLSQVPNALSGSAFGSMDAASSALNVPEPQSLMLLGVGLLGLLRRLRNRH